MQKPDAKTVLLQMMLLLPDYPDHRIWSDGDMIYCETEQLAEDGADLIDAMYGAPVAVTGSISPTEYIKEWFYVDAV